MAFSEIVDDSVLDLLSAKQRVDQPEIHDVAGDHDPGLLGVLEQLFSGSLGKRVGIQDLCQHIVLCLIPRRSVWNFFWPMN